MELRTVVLILIAVAAAVTLLVGLFFVVGFAVITKAWDHIMRDWENRDR